VHGCARGAARGTRCAGPATGWTISDNQASKLIGRSNGKTMRPNSDDTRSRHLFTTPVYDTLCGDARTTTTTTKQTVPTNTLTEQRIGDRNGGSLLSQPDRCIVHLAGAEKRADFGRTRRTAGVRGGRRPRKRRPDPGGDQPWATDGDEIERRERPRGCCTAAGRALQ